MAFDIKTFIAAATADIAAREGDSLTLIDRVRAAMEKQTGVAPVELADKAISAMLAAYDKAGKKASFNSAVQAKVRVLMTKGVATYDALAKRAADAIAAAGSAKDRAADGTRAAAQVRTIEAELAKGVLAGADVASASVNLRKRTLAEDAKAAWDKGDWLAAWKMGAGNGAAIQFASKADYATAKDAIAALKGLTVRAGAEVIEITEPKPAKAKRAAKA